MHIDRYRIIKPDYGHLVRNSGIIAMTISTKMLCVSSKSQKSLSGTSTIFYFTCNFLMWASKLIALKQSKLVKRPYRVHVKLRFTFDLGLKLNPLVVEIHT